MSSKLIYFEYNRLIEEIGIMFNLASSGKDVTVEHYISKFLSNTFSDKIKTENKFAFRVSSFPYCPIVDLWSRKYEKEQEESFSKDFYTNIGTSIHSLLQSSMPNQGKLGMKIFGSWKCSCGQVYSNMFLKQAIRKRKKKCKCNTMLEYEEVEFNLGRDDVVLSGHLDLLSCYKKYWIAWEFKSTGSFLFNANQYITDKYFPNKRHLIQIKSYCALLRMLYGIKVTHFVVVYINRERPDSKKKSKKKSKTKIKPDEKDFNFKRYVYEFTSKDYKEFKSKIELAIEGRKNVIDILNKKNLNKKKSVNRLVSSKPCRVKSDYEHKMKSYFTFKDNDCPFYINGQCFKRGLDTKLINLISDIRRN